MLHSLSEREQFSFLGRLKFSWKEDKELYAWLDLNNMKMKLIQLGLCVFIGEYFFLAHCFLFDKEKRMRESFLCLFMKQP